MKRRILWSAFLSVMVSALPCAAQQPIELQCAVERVGKYEKIEFRINATRSYANPFDPAKVDLSVELTAASGRRSSIPAFYSQDYERRFEQGPKPRDWMYPTDMPVWKAWFAPTLQELIQRGAQAKLCTTCLTVAASVRARPFPKPRRARWPTWSRGLLGRTKSSRFERRKR